MEGKRTLPEVTAIRAAAALLIVLFHAWYRFGQQTTGVAPDAPLIRHGWIAVDLFFVLSGYLLAGPFLRERAPGWAGFMGRRLLRIAPPYYVALGLSALFPFEGSLRDVALGDLAAHAFYLHGFLPGSFISLNPVFWTLAVELQFYLILPFLARMLSGPRAGWAFAGMAAVTLATRAWAYPHVGADAWGLVDLSLPAFLLHFAVGIVAARIAASGWTPARPARYGMAAGALALAAAGLALVPPGSYSQGIETFAANLLTRPLLAIGSGLLLLALHGPVAGWVSARPIQAAGTWSYSLYLVHIPLFILIDGPLTGHWVAATVGPLGPVAYVATLATASVAAAALFFHAVEQPVLTLRDRLALRRAVRATAPAPTPSS